MKKTKKVLYVFLSCFPSLATILQEKSGVLCFCIIVLRHLFKNLTKIFVVIFCEQFRAKKKKSQLLKTKDILFGPKKKKKVKV